MQASKTIAGWKVENISSVSRRAIITRIRSVEEEYYNACTDANVICKKLYEIGSFFTVVQY